MRARGVGWSLLFLALGGCVGQGTNQAPVFVPVSGPITLRVETPRAYAQVVYRVDGQQVAIGSDPLSGYQARYDSRSLVNGVHLVTATGTAPDGASQPLLRQTILVDNPG